MKKTKLSVLNAFICVLLITINTILACKYGLSNEGLGLICIASFFFLVYALGMIAPICTVRFFYKIGSITCKHSDMAKPVTEAEAIKSFKKGRVYLLLATNILLTLWLFSFLT
jgi:hypothetical protein